MWMRWACHRLSAAVVEALCGAVFVREPPQNVSTGAIIAPRTIGGDSILVVGSSFNTGYPVLVMPAALAGTLTPTAALANLGEGWTHAPWQCCA